MCTINSEVSGGAQASRASGDHFVDCPRCHGSGEIHWNPSPINDPQCEEWAQCSACVGDGAITFARRIEIEHEYGLCPLHHGRRQSRCPAMATPAATECPTPEDVHAASTDAQRDIADVGLPDDVSEAAFVIGAAGMGARPRETCRKCGVELRTPIECWVTLCNRCESESWEDIG